MSSSKGPVGPLSRSVYVRRRLLVFAGFVAVVAAVVLVIVKPGSSDGVADSHDVELPEGVSTSSVQKKGEKEPAGGKFLACAEGKLRVVPQTDKADYVEGEFPKLSLSVENIGDQPCTADVGTAGMLFEVTSGDDQVWRSSDCQKNAESLSVILDPGKPEEVEGVVWDRTRSSVETCDIDREPVSAGGASYHLWVTVAGVRSAQSRQFLLY